ncbi:probable ATP-dependent RNA helicase spindle-E [Anopheles aquasalis]|uniref:probable ATP-dependent RNA helicase spindle-E n=1 Tax=Anopheles aquasalis TaxID=42839 RepID=UPI00215A4894|nr:probable ATP-dependent RNA helicase spindle-E [Anopheles aquasalis]
MDSEEDDIMDFFDFSKPFQRTVVSGGYCNATVVPEPLNSHKLPEKPVQGTEYSASYARAEENRLIKAFIADTEPAASAVSAVDDVDGDSMMAAEDAEHLRRLQCQELMEPLFARYRFTMEPNNLPIYESKQKIVDTIREHPVVVLQGPTGCGKTTQVPQFLLEQAYQRGEYCSIVVTQPRRIAAISIAERVAKERDCDVGTLVGYKVGLKQKLSDDTRVLFVTTGVLLQWLINAKTAPRFTHIIMDEVHEREVDMDFLLIIAHRMLGTRNNQFKIILMSATIDAKVFIDYFKIPHADHLLPPVLHVARKHPYELRVFYLDDLSHFRGDFLPDYRKPGICEEMYMIAAKTVYACDQLIDEYEDDSERLNFKPSIIIFLPGIGEIDHMASVLNGFQQVRANNAGSYTVPQFIILKLHSMMPASDQAAVFIKPPTGYRKIILSTNIAESSITVPDVKFVIDFCLQRVLVADTTNNFSALTTQWAPRSNLEQRAGRAGRLMKGRVYRLIEKRHYTTGIPAMATPEMTRCPLGTVVLKAKLVDDGPPHAILGLALDPPNLSDICNTILQLKELGALFLTVRGSYSPYDGDMTYLGRVMAQLPMDLPFSKLVVLGYVFSVLPEAIIIAAGMSAKNIFSNQRNQHAFALKMHWADGSGSDGIAILNAYTAWRGQQEQRATTGGSSAEWCKRHGLELRSLTDMAELVREIEHRMDMCNLKEITGPNRVVWKPREKPIILKLIMAGAFYPNYFLVSRVTNDNDESKRNTYSVVGNRDPFSTVYLSGFEHRTHIGPLYRQQIRDLLTEGDRSKQSVIKVEFDRSQNRIFVRFVGGEAERYKVPGRIRPEVYHAIKIRTLTRQGMQLRVMHHADAVRVATEMGLGHWQDNDWVPKRQLLANPHLAVVPLVHCARLQATVTYVCNPSKFYLRPLDRNVQLFEDIVKQMNAGHFQPFPREHKFHRHDLVAAPVQQQQEQQQRYRRAQLITEHDQTLAANRRSWTVFFLDHGATEQLEVSTFRQLPSNLSQMPGQVFEASLAEVQPPAAKSPTGVWLKESVAFLTSKTQGTRLDVEVFSVVDRVANVVLRCGNFGEERTINEQLIEAKLAQSSEESYPSKINHEMRTRVQRHIALDEQYRKEILADDSELLRYIEDDDEEIVEPPAELLRLTLQLRGPYSPLETRCYSSMASSFLKAVSIEQDSVNSVLLESNPQDTHEKLVIATGINENPISQKLTIRQTTIMPNIPGMPALMTLIFAHRCVLKMDDEGTRVCGVLGGLGCDPNTGTSYYPEHDLSLPVDVEITQDDITDINALRYIMDSMLQSGRSENTTMFSGPTHGVLVGKVKEYILKILQRDRPLTVAAFVQNFEWLSPSDQGASSSSKRRAVDTTTVYDSPLFPLHPPLTLQPVKTNRLEFLQTHCAELHRLAHLSIKLPNGGITCKLCDVTLESQHGIRIHLYSKLHRDREHQIGYQHS